MLDHVLVATDGSAAGKRATEVALALAEQCDAAVDVVHVLEDADRTAGDRGVLDDAAATAADTDLAVETHALEGDPAERIVAFAADRGADLLVLGRRGRSGLGERLLGSVTERVLRSTHRSVLVVDEREAES